MQPDYSEIGHGNEAPIPELAAIQSSTPLFVDGKLTEASWQTAATTSPFWKLDGSAKVSNSASAQVSYDDIGLNIAFRCPLKEAPKVAQTLSKEAVWSDETVEIFLTWRALRDLAGELTIALSSPPRPGPATVVKTGGASVDCKLFLIETHGTESSERAEVKLVDGRGTLLVNGQPLTPIGYTSCFRADAGLAQRLTDTDIQLYFLWPDSGWTAPEQWHQVAEEARTLLAANTDVFLIMRVGFHPSEAWMDAHPEELETFEDGRADHSANWTSPAKPDS